MSDKGLGRSPRVSSVSALWVLTLVVVAAFTFRLVLQQREWTLTTDSFSYLLLAESLAAGNGYDSGGGQHPDLSRPPMLPILVAAGSKLGFGVEGTADILVALLGALAVIPLWLLARDLFGARAAWAALPLGAFSCLASASSRVLATTAFVFLALGAAYAAWRASRVPGVSTCVIAGLLAGAAALTRMEGMVWPPVLTAWVALVGPGSGRPRRAASAAILLGSATLLYAPYAIWASVRLGRFVPSPGTEYLQNMRDLSDRLGLRGIGGPWLDWTERARFILSADHRRLLLDARFHDDVLLEPDPETVDPERVAEYETASGTNWSSQLRRSARIAWRNAIGIPQFASRSHFLTPITVGLGLLGLAVALRRRERWPAIVFLVLTGSAALAPVASHLEMRFLYPLFGFGLVLCAAGWGWLDSILVGSGSALRRFVRGLVHLGIAAAVLLDGVHHKAGTDADPARRKLLYDAAAAIATEVPKGPILAVQPHFPYVAGMAYRPLPLGTPWAVLDFARAQGAGALVFEGARDLKRRPQMDGLLGDHPPPGFRLVFSAPHPEGREFRVFRLESGG